jgi:His/Glu/Gln/Arg/opine family amino acid ABC transporter permease subunit
VNFDSAVLSSNCRYFAQGLAETLLICAAALPVGYAAGAGLAVMGLRGNRALRGLARAFVELIRNVPFLIQVYILFFALPSFGIRLDPVTAGIIALASYTAAYFSEIVRGALATIPAGQSEAARALGLTFGQTLWRVLFPQILGYILPAGGNLAITLIKESAVLSAIAVRELTYMSQDVIGRTFAPVEVFTLLALLYWALTAMLAAITAALERRLRRSEVAAAPKRKSDLNPPKPQMENPR